MSAAPNQLMQIYQRLTTGRNTRAILVVMLAWVLQFSCVVLASVIVARYLGPKLFGTLNYVTAIMAIAGTLAGFGMGNVVTRELMSAARPMGVVLGTAVLVRAMTGALAMCLMLAYVYCFEPNAMAVTLVSVVVGILLIDGSLVFDCSLQSKREFGASSGAKAILAVNNLLMRGALVLSGASVVYFVAIQYIEILCYIAVFGWFTRKVLKGVKAGWDPVLAKTLLRHGFPIMLSSFATVIYLRIDQVMIEHLLGSEALGRYAAGVKLAEVASFFPGIIAYVLFPSIIEAYKVSAEKAEAEAIKLYRLMYASGFAFSLFMMFAGEWLTHIMFGVQYEGAGAVLKVYVWSTIFVFLTIASQAQLFSQAKTTHVVAVRTLVGAVVNIGLNFLLIPKMGIVGAAWATVISYGVAVFFFYDRQYSWPPVRSMLRALWLPV